MQLKTFQLGMRTVSAAMPYGKKLQDDELGFLFMTLPDRVKQDVTDTMWAYACSKTLSEQDPNKEIALHMRVLSHVYKIENGAPNFNWGLKTNDELIACGDDPAKLAAYRKREHQRFIAQQEQRLLECRAD